MSKSKKHDGLVARRSQDRNHPSSTVVEYVPAPPPRDSKYTVAKCHICNKPVSFRGTVPDVVTCKECEERPGKEAERARQAEEASRIHRTCKTCGKPFYIKASKAKELKEAGLSLFTTCYACQQDKKYYDKKLKEDKNNG